MQVANRRERVAKHMTAHDLHSAPNEGAKSATGFSAPTELREQQRRLRALSGDISEDIPSSPAIGPTPPVLRTSSSIYSKPTPWATPVTSTDSGPAGLVV